MSYPPPLQPEYATPSGYPTATPLGYAHAEIPVDPGNVWTAIWTRPRQVMRWVLHTDPTRNVQGLIFVAALAGSLDNVGKGSATVNQLLASLGLSVLIGTALGYLVSYFVLPWALVVVGRWLGGQGDRVALRAALAYSSIPGIAGIAVSVPAILLHALMLSSGPKSSLNFSSPLLLALMGLGALGFVLGIWQIVIAVNCVAVAHRFSGWLAFATMALILVILLAIAFAIVIPFSLLV